MSDIVEIKRMLADRAQAVAEMLLPGGRRDGQEWRAGSIDGEKGQSLGVHLHGAKAGIWQDFATGEGGDLLDLWCATRKVSLAQAIDDARQYLGVTRPEPTRRPKREYTRPQSPKCSKPKSRVLEYLTGPRAIPEHILAAYKIGEAGDDIVFPFLLPDGTLALAKKRKAEDGAAPKPTAANCEPVLFGWQAVPDDAREIVITEGEIDALSWAAYGYHAVSVPFGGGKGAKQQWIESEFERLDRFERIYLALDMDKPGEEAAAEIAERLGRYRCLRVVMPHKDGNACLVAGVSKFDMDACINAAVSLDPEGLRRPTDFAEEVTNLFWPDDDAHIGYQSPFGRLRGKLYFRPGEVTIWSGATGAGKSQILSHCVVDFVAQGSRVCVSSLEMKASQTLRRMVKQTLNADRPTEPAIGKALAWLDRGLLLYERVGKEGVDGLLEIFDYARAKYGCDQFVIDSFMRLGIAADDYKAQEQAMFRLVEWTIDRNVHLHLVAHARKSGGDRTGALETEEVKGAGEITFNAFNVLTVWRNRKVEDAVHNAPTDEARQDAAAKPGVLLNVAKQRNGDFEGKVGLWFDQDTYRYRSTDELGGMPRRYVE